MFSVNRMQLVSLLVKIYPILVSCQILVVSINCIFFCNFMTIHACIVHTNAIYIYCSSFMQLVSVLVKIFDIKHVKTTPSDMHLVVMIHIEYCPNDDVIIYTIHDCMCTIHCSWFRHCTTIVDRVIDTPNIDYNIQPTKRQLFNYCVIKHAWIVLKLYMIQYQVYTSIVMSPYQHRLEYWLWNRPFNL